MGACFLASILKADVEIAPMHSHPPGSDRDATRDLGRQVFGSPGGSILLAPLCDVEREGTRAREGQGILAEHGRDRRCPFCGEKALDEEGALAIQEGTTDSLDGSACRLVRGLSCRHGRRSGACGRRA